MVNEPAVADSPPDPEAILRSKQFLPVLALAAIVGIVASVVAWGFLEVVVHMQDWVFTDIPDGLGFDSPPIWWPLPVLAIAGVITAFAIVRLPGTGGHIPAEGLNPSPTQPIEVPGVILAGVASIGLGLVIGPEGPLIAIGSGLGLYAVHLVRRDAPEEMGTIIATSAMFAALAFLFGSPIIAAAFLIEAAGVGKAKLPLILVPGLIASGIGSLVWIGMGSWTGLDTSNISLSALDLPAYPTVEFGDFGWTIVLAAAIAIGTFAIFRVARVTVGFADAKPFVVLPAVGLIVAGLAIAFSEIADKSVNDLLFSGEFTLDSLVAHPGAWSISALVLLIVFKGVAYGLSLGAFRGGPVFPAIFLGATGAVLASHLPGFDLAPAVAVGIGAGVVAVLRLPLSAAVLAVVLTGSAGAAVSPLIMVGVVVAYLVTLVLSARWVPEPASRAAPG
jgi:H+/Cl- antiporter ClcA